MAIIQPTYSKPNGDDTSKLVLWSGLSVGDVGDPVQLNMFRDRYVQVTGVFGLAGGVDIEGSLDGVNWFVLNRDQSAALSFTSSGLAHMLENPIFIRPEVTGGDGTTALDVRIFATSPLSHSRK